MIKIKIKIKKKGYIYITRAKGVITKLQSVDILSFSDNQFSRGSCNKSLNNDSMNTPTRNAHVYAYITWMISTRTR